MYSFRELADGVHFVQSFREFVRYCLAFRHAHQPPGTALSHSSFSPNIEHHLIWTNPQTKQVIVVTIQSNVIELEGAIHSE